MNRSSLLFGVVILALLGLADAWYLAESALSGASLACDISGLSGCNLVAQSEYSRLFGVPLAVYGAVFYALFFVLSACVWFFHNRTLYHVLVASAVVGILASTYFLYLQFFVIKALCIYCIASFVIALLLFGGAAVLWKRFMPPVLVVIP